LAAWGGTAPAADSDPVLDRWLASQAELKTWSAEFTQIRHLKALTTPLPSRGRVWFAPPDRFRWELIEPAPTVAVRRTNEVWIVYPRLKRAERYELGSEPNGLWQQAMALFEAGFPRSRATLEARFDASWLGQTNGCYALVLQPRGAARRFMTQIQVGLRTNDLMLATTEVRFADGSVMRNEFTNAQLNLAPPPGVFDPPLEPGFRVVEPMRR
jgi:outer membrane lipoprotein-sorting protein